jgi:hypothetical protein
MDAQRLSVISRRRVACNVEREARKTAGRRRAEGSGPAASSVRRAIHWSTLQLPNSQRIAIERPLLQGTL